MPVNRRERGDGHLSSQVSLWRTELAPGGADAGARMRAIVHNTHTMRSEMAALRPLVERLVALIDAHAHGKMAFDPIVRLFEKQ